MTPRSRHPRLPRLLFFLAVSTSVALFVVVFAAPALDNGEQSPKKGAVRLTSLFARDLLVRRTAIAGAIGLLATAFIFFRTAGEGRASSRRGRPPRLPPPRNIAGA